MVPTYHQINNETAAVDVHAAIHHPVIGEGMIKRVFISSPFHGFQEEREAVQRALNRMSFDAVAMEHFGSFPDAPISRCIRLVKTADYLVLLAGGDLGSVSGESNRTYTEEEYHAAIESRIPVLAYFRQGEASSRVEAFREEIKRRHGLSYFESPDDLSWKVVSDLGREVLMSLPGSELAAGSPEDLMFRQYEHQKSALIQRLNARAAMILARFQGETDLVTANVLEVFRSLHADHIELISKGSFTLAHETLRQIYDLLETAAASQGFVRSSLLYQLSFPVPLEALVRSNYLLGRDGPPPSSPFSTIRLYDRLLAEPPRPTMELPIDALMDEK
jgi:hypothetical protein